MRSGHLLADTTRVAETDKVVFLPRALVALGMIEDTEAETTVIAEAQLVTIETEEVADIETNANGIEIIDVRKT